MKRNLGSNKIWEETMRKTLALSMLAILTVATSYAAGVGTTGGQFLRIGVGARAAGLGGAFSALADDATAIYWNPAGLAMLEKNEVSISHNAYFKDTSSQFLGYGHKMGPCTLGVSVNMFSVTDIEKRSATAGDADTPDGGTFKTQDMAGAVAWGHRFEMGARVLNVGVAAKYITSDLGDHDANTFAADLGAIAPLSSEMMGGSLQASLAVLNLGGELKFDEIGDPLPLNIKPGVAWKGKVADRMLNAVLDADLLLNDEVNLVNLGFEYWMIDQLGLRVGYQAGRDSGTGPGVAGGLGFRHAGLGVDYAFVPFGDLGNTHRVSVGYRF